MIKISVAIAVYNEEDCIGRCLDSVSGWCSEIIVVDGKSSDRTAEIVKRKGIKVFSTINRENFHINKNIAIDRCTGDWILQLDADEVVSPELRKEIISTINSQLTTNNRQPINGYWIPRKNYFLGKFLTKGGQYPDYTLRLYKRGKGRLPEKSVHEQAQVSGETGYLTSPLLHYSYPDFQHYLEHFDKYTTIFAHELANENTGINLFALVSYMFIKPVHWFLLTSIRHKGFMDGTAGLVFSFFSALRFPVSYIKYLRVKGK